MIAVKPGVSAKYVSKLARARRTDGASEAVEGVRLGDGSIWRDHEGVVAGPGSAPDAV